MRSPRLARLALRGLLTDTPLVRAALGAIVLVPLLYGALYLWAFWDPYGKLDSLPVALVNLDAPATVDGETLHAGNDLVDKLVGSHDVDWRTVSADEAAKGLRERRYYVSLTIPRDFSARLATANSEHPRRATLVVVAQESSNMLASQIMSRVFAEVRAGAAESASKRYIDKMFIGFTDARDGLTEASLGAKDLRDGLGKARSGARTLSEGTSAASQGADELASGLTTLADGAAAGRDGASALAAGSASLAVGLGTARDGAARLDAGASQVAGGSDELAAALSKLATGSRTAADSAAQLSAGASQLADGVHGALAQVGDAQRGAEKVAGGASGVARALHSYADAHPEAASDPQLAAALGGADAVESGAADLASGLGAAAGAAPALASGADAVAKGAQQLAGGSAQIAEGAARASAGSAQLAAGTARLADGARVLSAGISSADAGANSLAAGSAKLSAGSKKLAAGARDARSGGSTLAEGIGRLDSGASSLASGLKPAVDGSGELRTGLEQGATKLPSYDASLRSDNAEMMGAPVELTTIRQGKVPTYGSGFTPYFVPLALWVGALVTYLVVRPLPPRAIASAASPVITALAGYLPGAVLGILQALLLVGVIHGGLGLRPVNVAATYGIAVLTALVFVAILQMLNAALGAAGKLISIVLLMLQLTSAGGTFPTQMIPGFFQTLNPWLPMSYVVLGLRQTVSGGDLSAAAHAAVVLTAFGIGALAITAFSAWRKQTYTMERLHPSLSI